MINITKNYKIVFLLLDKSMEFFTNNELWTFMGVLLVTGISIMIVRKSIEKVRVFVLKLASKTQNTVDDEIFNKDIIGYTMYFIPLFILVQLNTLSGAQTYNGVVNIITSIMVPVVTALLVFSGINVIDSIYKKKDIYKKIPFFAGLQLLKIITAIITLIIIVSGILGKSPLIILSGLGAATAILMLVFKDVITGFISGIHLVTNNMLSKGDWITMPSKGVDGDVIEIGISTVKVRNFDKTITSVPAQQLVNNVFFNWKGMQSSGGRRIKRNLLIDANSIKLLGEEDIEDLKQIKIMNEYLDDKSSALKDTNKDRGVFIGDKRSLTNIGTFRAYICEYLKSRGDIYSDDFTFLVRQLEASEHGVPIQIYVFTTTTNWIEYEAIQSDVFDHLFSMVGVFGLKIYQRDNN